MQHPITAVLVGAGNRGTDAYGKWAIAHPDQLQIVAVAEPNDLRRERLAAQHAIPASHRFHSWEELFAHPPLARAAIITTQDQMHTGPALAALTAGYDVLLEKPMAHRLEDCIQIVQAAEAAGRLLQVCHVMRYTAFFQRVHAIVQSGRLGELITISHRENVLAQHMAHSFVRGNWRRADHSSPMILAKCCHDLDMLYWLTGRPVTRLASMGTLLHFRPEHAPTGAPDRCTDGCPAAAACPFYAPDFYIHMQPIYAALSKGSSPLHRAIGRAGLRHPARIEALARLIPPLRGIAAFSHEVRSIITDHPDDTGSVWEALRSGPYGRCVYHCDNDVVDHQVVMMEFEGGISATLTMHGHSADEGRTLRIDGSGATLLGKETSSQSYIEIRDHKGGGVEHIRMPSELEAGRHAGGDQGLMAAFVEALREDTQAPLTSGRASLESHLMAFAAEQARLDGTVIDMAQFRTAAEQMAQSKGPGS
ncbi:MAG: hypothetical protein Kow00124_01170 [Anaerolineae bacterium]